MTRTRAALYSLALALALPAATMGQAPTRTAPPKPKKESQAMLAAEAKVSLEAATAVAMKEVPGGKVASHELERENGKLIYSFDLKLAGKSGIEEVAVDAITGAMIEHTHESPADEKKEAQADLAKEARISLAAATATALKEVPGSTVKSHELERENGKLIYSFDMKTAGKSGIDEVNVDAMTGATVGKVGHEADAPPKKAPVKKP